MNLVSLRGGRRGNLMFTGYLRLPRRFAPRNVQKQKGQTVTSLPFHIMSYVALPPVSQLFFKLYDYFVKFIRIVLHISFENDSVHPFGDLVFIFDGHILF